MGRLEDIDDSNDWMGKINDSDDPDKCDEPDDSDESGCIATIYDERHDDRHDIYIYM